MNYDARKGNVNGRRTEKCSEKMSTVGGFYVKFVIF